VNLQCKFQTVVEDGQEPDILILEWIVFHDRILIKDI